MAFADRNCNVGGHDRIPRCEEGVTMGERMQKAIGATQERAGKAVKHPAVIASVVSMLLTGTGGWGIAKKVLAPWIVTTVRDAVAEDTDKKISVRVSPILETLKSNKESDIAEMEDELEAEKLRKQQNLSKWTPYDQLKLTQLERRLKSEREKLEELKREAAAANAVATR